MLPGWNLVRRISTALRGLAGKSGFRTAVAAALACMQLVVFAKAGHSRLGLPFNSHPDRAPYFSNPDAPATRGYPRQPYDWSRLIVSRWDAQHYIDTAVRGLAACPTQGNTTDSAYLDCGLGWLPAWGSAGGVLSRAGMPADVALFFLSVLAAILVNLLWTSEAIVKRIGRVEAYGALIAFNCFPAAFYLVTPYPTAAMVALVLGAFVALSTDRWILAGCLVGAATALDVSMLAFGIAVAAAAIVAAWRRDKAGMSSWWRPLIAVPLCGWGLAAETLILRIAVGDAHAYWRARTAFGEHHDFSRILHLRYYLDGFTAQHLDVVILLGTILIIALTCRPVLRRFTLEEAVFLVVGSAVTIAIAIAYPNLYWGMTRYLLLCPLTFLGAAYMMREHTTLFVLWLVLCVAIFWHVDLCGYLSQGNHHVCPCLGRFELAMPFGP